MYIYTYFKDYKVDINEFLKLIKLYSKTTRMNIIIPSLT